MIRSTIAALALCSVLAACGGGGGTPEPTPASTPAVQAVAPNPQTPNCRSDGEGAALVISCDLIASDEPIGAGVAAGGRAVFTNRTGLTLQITESTAFTNERQFWSEYCVYLDWVHTGQMPAGKGEVGCAAKNVGEDYAPIHWGAGTGLIVPPGHSVWINAHTEPAPVIHIYSLRVQYLDAGTGVQSWRMPQQDRVIPCDGQVQRTEGTPWRNDTGRELHINGASIYAETPQSVAPNTMSVAACLYVLAADGSHKYVNCDNALRTKGVIHFPPVHVAPAEYVIAQATNVCPAHGHWNWVAFLNMR